MGSSILKPLLQAAAKAFTAAAVVAAGTLARRLTDRLCDRVLKGERPGPAGRTGRRRSAAPVRQPLS